MPGLIIWKKQEIDRLKRDMDRLLARLWDDFCIPIFPRGYRETPFVDLSETEDRIILRAEIPGVAPEDLDISITDDTLTIRGESRENLATEGEDYRSTETDYGYFSRSIPLPCKVQASEVKATYKDGLLTITMPKCKPEPPREVKVRFS